MLPHGIGLEQSILIYDLRVQCDFACIGDDFAAIINSALGQTDAGADPSPIRALANQHFFARFEMDFAAGGGNRAVVLHAFGEEEE